MKTTRQQYYEVKDAIEACEARLKRLQQHLSRLSDKRADELQKRWHQL